MKYKKLICLLFATSSVALAQTSSYWDGQQTGEWGDASGWFESDNSTPSTIPNGVDHVANFSNNSFYSGWGSISLEVYAEDGGGSEIDGADLDVTLGTWSQTSVTSGRHIDVRSEGTGGAATMTLDVSSGNAAINHHANSTSSGLTFQVVVQLNDNLVVTTTGNTIATGYREGVTFNNAVSGAASITKNGASTLSFEGSSANSFSGGLFVNDGLVQGMKDGAFGTGDIHVAETSATSTATVEIADGVNDAINDLASLYLVSFDDGSTNYSTITLAAGVNETIAALYFDGVLQSAGTWGATGSGADFINDNWFAGTGVLSVVPEPASFGVLLGALSLGFVAVRRRR